MAGRVSRVVVVAVLVAAYLSLGGQRQASAGPPFKDLQGHVAWDAATNLARLGIVKGCDPPNYDYFCPEDPTLRHQLAALIVRAMPGWADETWSSPFTDPTTDMELWRRVGTLAHHGVVVGYQPEVCRAQGKASPCYGPLDNVTFGQALLFIGRAMVAQGYWALLPDDRSQYPDRNGVAGADPATDQQTLDHRLLVTFKANVGEPRDVWVGPSGDFRVTYWQDQRTYGWGDPAPRGWFVRVLWQVLSEYPGGVLPAPSPSPLPTPAPTPPPTPQPTPSPAPGVFNPHDYIGQGDRYNCADFASQARAQAVLRADPGDPNQLDTDKNGIACESNPAPKDLAPVPRR